eukprot:12579_1
MDDSSSTKKRKRKCPQRAPPRTPRPHLMYPGVVPMSSPPVPQKSKGVLLLELKIEVLQKALRVRNAELRQREQQDAAAKAKPKTTVKRKNTNHAGLTGAKRRHFGTNGTPAAIPAVIPAQPAVPVTDYRRDHKVNPSVTLSPSMRACGDILVNVMNHRLAYAFNLPVDWKRLNIPNYPRIIKQPMDLGTVLRKLETGEYQTVDAFKADVTKIWVNAMTFNMPGTPVYKMAHELSTYCSNLLLNNPSLAQTPQQLSNGVVAPPPKISVVQGQPPAKSVPSASSHDLEAQRIMTLDDNDYDAATGRVRELSPAQKAQIKSDLQRVPTSHIMTIVKMLQKENCGISQNSDNTLEIDINGMTEIVRWKVFKYIKFVERTVGLTKPKAAAPVQTSTAAEIKQIESTLQVEYGHPAPVSQAAQPTTSAPPIPLSQPQSLRGNISDSESSSESESDESEDERVMPSTSGGGRLINPDSASGHNQAKPAWKMNWSTAATANRPNPRPSHSQLSGGPAISSTGGARAPVVSPPAVASGPGRPNAGAPVQSGQSQWSSQPAQQGLSQSFGSVPPPPPSQQQRTAIDRQREIARLQREGRQGVNLNFQNATLQNIESRYRGL